MSLAMLVWWSRFRARAPRRRASASVRPFSTREPGLSLVLGAQVCASAAASGFLGAFCVQDGATVHPASKARTGFDIVMLHSSRVWIALLGIAVASGLTGDLCWAMAGDLDGRHNGHAVRIEAVDPEDF